MISEFSAASSLAHSWRLRSWFVPAAASFLVLLFVFATDRHTWELDAASFWFEPPSVSSPAPFPMEFEPCWLGAPSIPGRFDALELGAVEELAAVCDTKFNVGFDSATILLLFLVASFSTSFRGSKQSWKCWCLEQMDEMLPFITGEIARGQYVGNLVLGINIFDLDLVVQVSSVK